MVVEKVFTATSEEADRLIALAKGSNKILTVYQSKHTPQPYYSTPLKLKLEPYSDRRYDSDFLTLEHLVTSQYFGKITECELHYDIDFPFWIKGWSDPGYKPGDGMLAGLGSHTIDQALQLFGKPGCITGFLRSLRGIESETEDTFI